ncbi:hypothetical protein NM688_g1714 [Phlebia brevispora]|uniref:Uncharacterized protein n=1 Tax=Phlebia brevispora TaxID=194682 RepID=A0ACC1TAZ7_9APHY|nr:hypothetical protein NM688_g1714 [Phlebia brevispora]
MTSWGSSNWKFRRNGPALRVLLSITQCKDASPILDVAPVTIRVYPLAIIDGQRYVDACYPVDFQLQQNVEQHIKDTTGLLELPDEVVEELGWLMTDTTPQETMPVWMTFKDTNKTRDR